ncbi:MAG TPA: FMN-binding protein, partial [bacterium]|nr:FMN-binding protein [bacterium]
MMNRIRTVVMAAAASVALGAATATAGAQAKAAAYNLADGSFTGRREYAYYGFVKVAAEVTGGRLTNVRVLEYPRDNGTSRYINGIALPYLIREAVQSQSGSVDLISGATFTSDAF